MFRRAIFPFFLVTFVLAFTMNAEDIEYDVSVSLVNIWVKATDGGGRPLTGLTSSDFKVLEDGKPVNIECFDEVKYKPAEEDLVEFLNEGKDQAEAEESEPKNFILFMDLLNTTTGELKFMTDSIQDFVITSIGDRSQVMLAALLPNRKMGILSPFSTNHEHIADMIAKVPGNQSRDQDVVSNERTLLQMIRTWESTTGGPGGQTFAGGQSASTPSDFFRQASQTVRVFAAEEKHQGMFTLKALRSFGDYLSSKDLGKHTLIIYIGGGFSLEPGTRYERLLEEAMNKYAMDREQVIDQVYNLHEQDLDLVDQIRDTTWYLNRLNITLYTLDSRGLVTGGTDISQFEMNDVPGGRGYFAQRGHQDSLRFLADNTGGLSFTGTQNFTKSLGTIIEDLNHQYLICYRAPEHKKKGSFHKIEVTSAKPDVKLRYRKGYLS